MATPELADALDRLFMPVPHYLPVPFHGFALPLAPLQTLFDHLGNELLPDGMQQAVPKRRYDFIGGRLCAERALQHLGHPLVAIGRNARDGAPVWPPGMIGSISHAEGVAYAVACTQLHDGNIGIDTERILDGDALEAVRNVCLSPSETLRYAGDMDLRLPMSVIFAAKEALYKAIGATLGRIVDFTEVQTGEIDFASGRVSFEGGSSQLVDVVRRCEGYFRIDRQQVFASVVLAPER